MTGFPGEPPPAPTEPPSLGGPPPRETGWRELLAGTAIMVAVGILGMATGQFVAALLVIPLLGIVLVIFPGTRAYGLGVLISYGVAWALLLAICGGLILYGRH